MSLDNLCYAFPQTCFTVLSHSDQYDEMPQHMFLLTLKAPIATAQQTTFINIFSLFFRENKT